MVRDFTYLVLFPQETKDMDQTYYENTCKYVHHKKPDWKGLHKRLHEGLVIFTQKPK